MSMERRGFFKSLLGVLAMPFAKDLVKVVTKVDKPIPVSLSWDNTNCQWSYWCPTVVPAVTGFTGVNSQIGYWNHNDSSDPWLYKNASGVFQHGEYEDFEVWSGT